MTVTLTRGCQAWFHHDKAEALPLVSASAVPTGSQVFSCEITVSRVPCRNSDRSQPGVVMWLTTPSVSAGQALRMSTPSPASTKRCSPSVFTRSPSSTPAVWLLVPEKSPVWAGLLPVGTADVPLASLTAMGPYRHGQATFPS